MDSIPDKYSGIFNSAQMPEHVKRMFALTLWASSLVEEVLPYDFTPRITRPIAVGVVKYIISQGIMALPLEIRSTDQLEDYALFRGLQEYQVVTEKFGTVYRMDISWTEIDENLQ